MRDLLNVEFYNDNLKMLNQVWEETVPAFRNDLDEHVLVNFYERQVTKSTLMMHAMTLYQEDIVLKKNPRSFSKLRIVVNDSLEQQQQNILILTKSAQESSSSILLERSW